MVRFRTIRYTGGHINRIPTIDQQRRYRDSRPITRAINWLREHPDVCLGILLACPITIAVLGIYLILQAL